MLVHSLSSRLPSGAVPGACSATSTTRLCFSRPTVIAN